MVVPRIMVFLQSATFKIPLLGNRVGDGNFISRSRADRVASRFRDCTVFATTSVESPISRRVRNPSSRKGTMSCR
jgi:hypothetical protein